MIPTDGLTAMVPPERSVPEELPPASEFRAVGREQWLDPR
jgi:hypothetical protein